MISWPIKSLTVRLRCFFAALMMVALAATPFSMPEAAPIQANDDEPVICSLHSHGKEHSHNGQNQCSGCLLCTATDVAAIPLQDVALPTSSRIEEVRYIAASQLLAIKPIPTNRQATGPPALV